MNEGVEGLVDKTKSYASFEKDVKSLVDKKASKVDLQHQLLRGLFLYPQQKNDVLELFWNDPYLRCVFAMSGQQAILQIHFAQAFRQKLASDIAAFLIENYYSKEIPQDAKEAMVAYLSGPGGSKAFERLSSKAKLYPFLGEVVWKREAVSLLQKELRFQKKQCNEEKSSLSAQSISVMNSLCDNMNTEIITFLSADDFSNPSMKKLHNNLQACFLDAKAQLPADHFYRFVNVMLAISIIGNLALAIKAAHSYSTTGRVTLFARSVEHSKLDQAGSDIGNQLAFVGARAQK